MTLRGLPDASRACRIILKDYVNGRILYCHAPPNVDQDEYFSLSHEHTATTISGNDAMGEDEIAKEHGNTEIKEKVRRIHNTNSAHQSLQLMDVLYNNFKNLFRHRR